MQNDRPLTAKEYVDLLVECDIARANLEQAISEGQREEGVATLYRRYLELLTRKRQAIVR